MKYTIDELTAAKRQIDSTLHKLRETVKTFESKDNSERYKSQITLAKRRIKAFEIANYAIENETKNCSSTSDFRSSGHAPWHGRFSMPRFTPDKSAPV